MWDAKRLIALTCLLGVLATLHFMQQSGQLSALHQSIGSVILPAEQASNWRSDADAGVNEMLKVAEEHLSRGENHEAVRSTSEALRYKSLFVSPELCASAVRLRYTALSRLVGYPLGRSWVEENDLITRNIPPTWRAWCDELGNTPPLKLTGGPTSSSLKLDHWPARSGSRESIEGIAVTINGVATERVCIDTGSEHTVLTTAAAQAAGIKDAGEASSEITGFASTAARPAVVKSLTIGEITITNVPVLVADTPPLIAADAQAAIGIDVLYRLRVTVDYPASRVQLEPATSLVADDASSACLQIPLWTYSQVVLAQIEFNDGTPARTLIDTGNRSGTFMSRRWAEKHLQPNRSPVTSLLPWFKHARFELPQFTLGGQQFTGWKVSGYLPEALERLETIDLLIGHDLLAGHRVTIDLAGRKLTLCESVAP